MQSPIDVWSDISTEPDPEPEPTTNIVQSTIIYPFSYVMNAASNALNNIRSSYFSYIGLRGGSRIIRNMKNEILASERNTGARNVDARRSLNTLIAAQ